MAEGARVAEASGAHVIDINMGCPAKRVTNGWSGSALMRDLDHAQTLIEAVRAAVRVPVTLKMRLGWDHASLNAPELARRAEDCGLAMVTVHGRTRQQFYKGQADWAAIRAVRAATRLPLVVNGDIDGSTVPGQPWRKSGADAVMIGRARWGAPWLVAEVGAAFGGEAWQKPDLAMQALAIREHYTYLIETMGAFHGVRHARKHIAAFAQHLGAEGITLPPGRLAAILQTEDATMSSISSTPSQAQRRQGLPHSCRLMPCLTGHPKTEPDPCVI